MEKQSRVYLGGLPGATTLEQPAHDATRETAQVEWLSDRAGLFVLAAITTVAAGFLFSDGTLMGQDSATQFYPWYDYLGERLSTGQVPAWNPYQFGGAPFAGDPQSGWMYLPAMLIFTILPLPLAAPTFLVFHLLLAGVAMYLLARILGIGVAGALISGVAYQLSGPVLGRSVCCPAAFEVASLAPIALLGAEIAIRQRDWRWRVPGWALAGIAVSQALAAWLGQGAYYLLIALGAFIAYRTLIKPADDARRPLGRVVDLALHGGVVLSIGFGLAAASILPRLEYVARSNVAGGEYSGENNWAAEIGGVTPSMVFERVLDPGLHYPGAAVLFLVLLSLAVPRRWFAAPFFIIFGLLTLILASPFRTPLHQLLYGILPRFEELHTHWPERIAMVAFMSSALLAGAVIDVLTRERAPEARIRMSVAVIVPSLIVAIALGAGMPVAPLALLGVTAAAVVALTLSRSPSIRAALPAIIVVVIAFDLLLGFRGIAANAPYGGFHRVDLETYYSPDGAARFLRERSAQDPVRYIGFDPSQTAISDGQQVLYRFQFAERETGALLVNNRGTLHGIEDAQGYNPVQPRRFVEYLTALNGHVQEYHDANVYFAGITSPLFDLLNIRYIVIPSTPSADSPDLLALEDRFPTVYADRDVKVLENRAALPRAWVVHNARQVAEGEALELLASGTVDARGTALLESPLPPLAQPAKPADERVEVLSNEPERVRVVTETTAPGLLMLSAAHDPGWRAYIDGKETPVVVADHMFQAIELPAGEHVIELRYQPPMLWFGLLISALVAGILAGALIAVGWYRWRMV